MVRCKYLDDEGKCTWRYEGFRCIDDKCPYYIRITTERCEYLTDEGYCKKYGRFFCAGVGHCDTEAEYKENMRRAREKISQSGQ